MSDFNLTVDEHDGVVEVALEGELDISTAMRLEGELLQVEARNPAVVVLDLRRLDFMDSTGIRLVLAANERARAAGRRFALVQGTEIVRRVLKVTRLDERLEIVERPEMLAEAASAHD